METAGGLHGPSKHTTAAAERPPEMVSSVNDHIKPPKGAVFVRADARDGWFVVTYEVSGKGVEIFYNQIGREVFRVDFPPDSRTWWERLFHANPNTTA